MKSPWTTGVLRATRPGGQSEIVKLGGSVLTLPGWPELVGRLLDDRGHGRRVLVVVGGGAIVDGLRAIDEAAPLPEALTHDLAISLLASTARLVAAALGLPLTEGDAASPAVLDVPGWLAARNRARRLPIGWQTTSDSIAAAVAAETAADLLLVKRRPPPREALAGDLAAAAQSGWIDDQFPIAAAGLGHIAWAAPASVPVPGVGGPAFQRRGAQGG